MKYSHTSCFLSWTMLFPLPCKAFPLSPWIILWPTIRNIFQIGLSTGNISWFPPKKHGAWFFEIHRIWSVVSPIATFPALYEDTLYSCHGTSCKPDGFVKVSSILPVCFLCRSFAYSHNAIFVHFYIYALILPHLFPRWFAVFHWIFVKEIEETCCFCVSMVTTYRLPVLTVVTLQ